MTCLEDSTCIALDDSTGVLIATPIISPAEGNALTCTAEGLYVPGGTMAEGVLPADPNDGLIAYYLASDAEGVVWALRYRADSTSLYKWEFVGGSDLRNANEDLDTYSDATPAAGYVNIPGGAVGPELTVPLAGDYWVSLEAMIDGGADGTLTSASVRRGAVAAVFDDAIANYTNRYVSVARTIRMNGLAASTLLKLQYHKESASDAQFGHRLLAIRPIRVKAA